jgi:plasmid stabilization system protein ParE
MKARKIISIHAKNDLSNAIKWYEKQQKGLGKRFLHKMKEAFDKISSNPTGFRIRYDNYRIYFTKTFPYGIHYQYLSEKNEIYIKAVFHTSRNPQIWE